MYRLTILTALPRKTTRNWNYSGSVYCWSNRLHKCTLLPLQDTIMCTQTTQKVSFNENHTMSDLTVCRHYEFSFTRLSHTLDSSTGGLISAATFTAHFPSMCTTYYDAQSEPAVGCTAVTLYQQCVRNYLGRFPTSYSDDQTSYQVYIKGSLPLAANFKMLRVPVPSPIS